MYSMSTTTRHFGSSDRSSHDSSGFYARFDDPAIDLTGTIGDRSAVQLDVVHHADARHMHHLPANTVGFAFTSPPYFAGKEYELDGVGGAPRTFAEYIEMLDGVISECHRVLEPGGRIAINVANLGRTPYRSLSAIVVEILERQGFLLRGEIIWRKSKSAGGSCAWGSFNSAASPTIRDTTERIIVASKDRFDRCHTREQRRSLGLPHLDTITKDEFGEATTDVWDIPPESATRVGHPAPFPVTLAQRAIEMFSYLGDIILDPFMGSGTTAIAAIRSGRHYLGYDHLAKYVELADARIAAALASKPPARKTSHLPANARELIDHRESFRNVVLELFKDLGFTDIKPPAKGRPGQFSATSPSGSKVTAILAGSFALTDTGMRNVDVAARAKAAFEAERANGAIIVTTRRAAGAHTPSVFDIFDPEDMRRLASAAT